MRGTPEPVEIEKVDLGHLRIVWDDGHESLYRFAQLRSDCPCATCGSRPRKHPGLLMSGASTPRALEPVGRYALNIEWADGHTTGIYSWDSLRGMCPCEECTRAR